MTQDIHKQFDIPFSAAGSRLDQALSDLLPAYSRALIQSWIKAGQVLVDAKVQKPKYKLIGGESVTIHARLEAQDNWQAQDISLDIVYEDEHLLVVNKPVGLVVHPAAGNPDGTLLNALIHHHTGQDLLPRAGIVHRLDKDTSGLMVVAKSMEAYTGLVQCIQQREFTRCYLAIALGEMTGGRDIDFPIGRHPVQRTRMAVRYDGKEALTHVRLLARYKGFTYVQVQLETGRTHQIRVHMNHIGFPLLGDPVYGGRRRLPKACSETLTQAIQAFQHQALHACYLALEHPMTGEYLEWEQEAPADFREMLALIAQECGE